MKSGIFIPAINERDGKIIELQTFMSNNEYKDIVVTGLIDVEIEQSIYLTITILMDMGISLPNYLHIHFPDYTFIKSGISASLGIFLNCYIKLNNEIVSNSYLVTGEIDIYGNVWEVGGIIEKYELFKKSNIEYFIIPEKNLKQLRNIKLDNNVVAIKTVAELISKIGEIENV